MHHMQMEGTSLESYRCYLLQWVILGALLWAPTAAEPTHHRNQNTQGAVVNFGRLVPELHPVTIGGSITLQCPCGSGSQRWCVATKNFGPTTLRSSLDRSAGISTDATQCPHDFQSSVAIGNVQQWMDGAMFYCAHDCTDPSQIVGGVNLLHTPAVPGNTEFSHFVPELKTVAIGGSVSLHCPCDGGPQQHWCVASSTIGPLRYRFSLDGVSQVSTTQCLESTHSSITISNIQQNMDGVMVYCARECNDPLGIVGRTKLLHTIAAPVNLEFGQLVPKLHPVRTGGNINLQCPCSGAPQRWCVATKTFGPTTIRPSLDAAADIVIDSTQCSEDSQPSVSIGNVQQWMEGAMFYCAVECNDPLSIIGEANILYIADTPTTGSGLSPIERAPEDTNP